MASDKIEKLRKFTDKKWLQLNCYEAQKPDEWTFERISCQVEELMEDEEWFDRVGSDVAKATVEFGWFMANGGVRN